MRQPPPPIDDEIDPSEFLEAAPLELPAEVKSELLAETSSDVSPQADEADKTEALFLTPRDDSDDGRRAARP